MPELPEVEHLRRTLEPVILGARVTAVHLHRHDVFTRSTQKASKNYRAQLLLGTSIREVSRRGKNLFIIAQNGRVLCVHLGMSGQVRVEYMPAGSTPVKTRKHEHCTWLLARSGALIRMAFIDPRRFGELSAYADTHDLQERKWSRLGPDALNVSSAELYETCRGSRRTIKSLLLDQSALAGVGNIYADEALFRARINPCARCCQLSKGTLSNLAKVLRSILNQAIESNGSTIRSYRDAHGNQGDFASNHCVYGRAGQPCVRCASTLRSARLSQRTTVWCPQCQIRSG